MLDSSQAGCIAFAFSQNVLALGVRSLNHPAVTQVLGKVHLQSTPLLQALLISQEQSSDKRRLPPHQAIQKGTVPPAATALSTSSKTLHSFCTCWIALAASAGSGDRVPQYLMGGVKAATAKLDPLTHSNSSKKLACSASKPFLSSPGSSWNCWKSSSLSKHPCLTMSSSSSAHFYWVEQATLYWKTSRDS